MVLEPDVYGSDHTAECRPSSPEPPSPAADRQPASCESRESSQGARLKAQRACRMSVFFFLLQLFACLHEIPNGV